MNKQFSVAGTIALLAIAGCSDSDSAGSGDFIPTEPTPLVTARVQVLHASPDAPEVNVRGVAAGPIGPIDYKTGGAPITVETGTYDSIEVYGILPGGAETMDPVLALPSLTLEADTLYTVIATGKDLDLSPSFFFAQPDTPVDSMMTRVRVAHAAPDAGEVSVFLTAPEAPLDESSMPVITFDVGGVMETFAEVPAGQYRVRVTGAVEPMMAPGPVVYDSGEITLPGGASLQIAAVENTTSGDALDMDESPITLIIMDGSGSSELIDQRNPEADVRVIHASADTPAVDVIANGAVTLVSDLAFPNADPSFGFAEVAEGEYDILVTDAATNMAQAIVLDDFPLNGGVVYDVIAFDRFATIQGDVLTDDYRRIDTAAKLRAFHASTVAQELTAAVGGVDIYVQPAGTDLSTVDPTVAGVELGDNTGFLQLPPDQEWVVSITAAGDSTAVISAATGVLAAGGIYTAIARDVETLDDVALTLLDDWVAP